MAANDPPTEKQINFVISLGGYLPANATREDVSYWIQTLEQDPEKAVTELKRKCGNEPAMPKQLQIIRDLGTQPPEGLKKARAHTMIAELRAARAKQNEEERDRFRSWFLKQEIHEWQQELAKADKEDKADYREDLKTVNNRRLDYWQAACGKDFMDEYAGFEECPNYCQSVEEAHARFGEIFQIPTRAEVAKILSELDERDANWDKQTPLESFFAKYRELFPAKLKSAHSTSRSQPRAVPVAVPHAPARKPVGMLDVIIGCGIVFLIFYLLVKAGVF